MRTCYVLHSGNGTVNKQNTGPGLWDVQAGKEDRIVQLGAKYS